jgi:alkylhydroperoxidase family enzyme
MFLLDVEAAETKSPFFDVIQAARKSGAEYPQIWHMFAFQPQATKHLEHFTQAIMREPGPISPGLRELIAAFTSARNDCPF